jgi:hypothetical protein
MKAEIKALTADPVLPDRQLLLGLTAPGAGIWLLRYLFGHSKALIL